ncbi:MAG: hypothetical protein ACNYPE_16000 [Candidatus Azotimanducaceae bacterium WSBS_2022_MAG_OTU7]
MTLEYISVMLRLRSIQQESHITRLNETRASIFPENQDTWESIALRELPDMGSEEAVGRLQSWNLHVFMRPAAAQGSARFGNPILPSDIIFVAPPQA